MYNTPRYARKRVGHPIFLLGVAYKSKVRFLQCQGKSVLLVSGHTSMLIIGANERCHLDTPCQAFVLVGVVFGCLASYPPFLA